jgi:hypothetical protein
MISNDKVINCKVIDFFEQYNFDLKFVFVQLSRKSYEFYYATFIFY